MLPRSFSAKAFARIALVAVVLSFCLVAQAQAQAPSFSKAFFPNSIGPGSFSQLTFTISNNTGSSYRNAAFSDTLPAGVTIATPGAVESSCSGSVSAPDGGSTIVFSGGGIAANSTCTISVYVTASAVGTYTNVSGDLTSDAGNSGSASADLTVTGSIPGFSKAFSPSSVGFGGRTKLTFTIDNTANGSQVVTLGFTDNLPSGMTIASPANATTTCAGGNVSNVSATAGSSTFAVTNQFLGTTALAAGSSCTYSVDVIAASAGTIENVSGNLFGTVNGPLFTGGNAGAVLTVTNEQVFLSKSFTDDPVAPGENVNIQFTIQNVNRSSSATGITFTDDLDAALSGLAVVSIPLGSPCGSGSTLTGSSVLTLSGGNLSAGGSCTFSATLQVPSSASPGEYLNTTSSMTGDLGGRPFTSSSASDTLFVASSPILTKSFPVDVVGAGDTATIDFTVTNTSTEHAATNLTFTDNLDDFLSGTTIVSGVGANVCGSGSFLSAAQIFGELTLILSGGNLAAGASCSFSVVVLTPVGAQAGGYLNETSLVTGTVDGGSVQGDAASDTLTIVSGPIFTKTFVDDPVAAGDTVILQFDIAQDDESTIAYTGIQFTDNLSDTLSGLVAIDTPITNVCGGGDLTGTSSLTFSGGSLAAGESCSIQVTLQVPASAVPGSYTNTTSSLVGDAAGVGVQSQPAVDDLDIGGLSFTKTFLQDPVLAGSTVTLQFDITNESPSVDASSMFFTDSLNNMLSGAAAVAPLPIEPCGVGSSISGTSSLTFVGGNLLAGASCSFTVDVSIPSNAADGTYSNITSSLFVDFDGTTSAIDPASDSLTIDSKLLAISKEFTNDPVAPGSTVNLEFTIQSLAGEEVTGITFTDDLSAVVAGLTSISSSQSDVCGTGSLLSGGSTLTLMGGSLAAGGSCTFSATLSVPTDVELGAEYVNTTGEVSGSIGSVTVTGGTASDTLQIDSLTLSKSFSPSTAEAGDTVTLSFTITNESASETIDGVAFEDDLDAALSGLAATGLPSFGDCGEESIVSGTSVVALDDATLLPGGSCTINVDVVVPAGAAPGDYLNVTSDLTANGLRAGAPAEATLTIIENLDDDGDGVLNGADVCPDTVIPEAGVPSRSLGVNRWALVDGDGIFDTRLPPGGGNGPGLSFTIEDTAGCSCEQIIEAQGLGQGHVKFGCSISAMEDWVALVGN